MWKFLNDSTAGRSHRASGTVCQDHSSVQLLRGDGEPGPVLILACADGAGSAALAEVGSRLACEVVVDEAAAFFAPGRTVADAGPEVLGAWMAAAHASLDKEALRRGVAARELACTLLVAVVGRAASAFGQIGDGVIVVRDGDHDRHDDGDDGNSGGGFRPVFWPDTGEYHNTTYFVTDPAFGDHVRYAMLGRRVDELALLTDGLQMLALNYANRTVHRPFFEPMFRSLRASADARELAGPLRRFLDSDAIDERTDDDKTLVLATRLASGGPTTP